MRIKGWEKLTLLLAGGVTAIVVSGYALSKLGVLGVGYQYPPGYTPAMYSKNGTYGVGVVSPYIPPPIHGRHPGVTTYTGS